MNRRTIDPNRLGFGTLKRADQLNLGDRILLATAPYNPDPFIIREVVGLRLIGDDVEIECLCLNGGLTTSQGNTFVVLNHDFRS